MTPTLLAVLLAFAPVTPRELVHPPAVPVLRRVVPGHSLRGVASFYAWRVGQAAACAPLRAALGPNWRGRLVTVSLGAVRRIVRLTDYCPQTRRLIDLDSRTFDDFAALSRGLVRLVVTW